MTSGADPGLPEEGHSVHGRIPKKQLELLKTVPIFSSCSSASCAIIAQLVTSVDVDARALPHQAGISPDASSSWSSRVWPRAGSVGSEVRRFGPGNFFGEMALLYGGVRTADVVATSEMQLLVLDSREFRSMLMTTPTIGVKMLSNLAERLSDADDAYTA